tara:strand:- start:638 stop:802 length:165 start_codon:yes stop_codon:yes gene_type:complete
MKPKDPNAPYLMHGVNISYFTGKLEAYMPDLSLKGTHIALSSPRGWRLGAQPRN